MGSAAHYQANLAGDKVALHDGVPQPGYYRLRRHKNGPFLPVAIWNNKEGMLVCRVAGEMADPEETWVWCCANPVSRADAKAAFETGKWPGDVPSIGHNAAPEETLSEKIARIASDALSWLRKTGIRDQVGKNMAANYRDQLNALKKEADNARDAEKRPHLEAGREIDAKYKPLITEADDAAGELRTALTIYMRAEEDAARKVADAAKKAAEAEAKRLAATNAVPVEALSVPAAMFEPPKVRAGGQYAKQTGLKTKTSWVISDYALALEHVKDHADVRAAVEKVCRAMAKSGATVPGVTKTEERVAG